MLGLAVLSLRTFVMSLNKLLVEFWGGVALRPVVEPFSRNRVPASPHLARP